MATVRQVVRVYNLPVQSTLGIIVVTQIAPAPNTNETIEDVYVGKHYMVKQNYYNW